MMSNSIKRKSPSKNIQTIVITQSTTRFAQSVGNLQTVNNSLEEVGDWIQTGPSYLNNLREKVGYRNIFKKLQSNFKRPVADKPFNAVFDNSYQQNRAINPAHQANSDSTSNRPENRFFHQPDSERRPNLCDRYIKRKIDEIDNHSLRQTESSPQPQSSKKSDIVVSGPENTPVDETVEPDEHSNLVSCRHCYRRFLKNRIETHEEICERTKNRQRDKYDATKQRIKGTDLEIFFIKKAKNIRKTRAGDGRRQNVNKNTSSRFGDSPTFSLGDKCLVKRKEAERKQRPNNSKILSSGGQSKKPVRSLPICEDLTKKTRATVDSVPGNKGIRGRQAEINKNSSSRCSDTNHTCTGWPNVPGGKISEGDKFWTREKNASGRQIEVNRKSSVTLGNSSVERFGNRGKNDSKRQLDINIKSSSKLVNSKIPPRPLSPNRKNRFGNTAFESAKVSVSAANCYRLSPYCRFLYHVFYNCLFLLLILGLFTYFSDFFPFSQIIM